MYACFFHESNNDNIHNLESMTYYENYAGIFFLVQGKERGYSYPLEDIRGELIYITQYYNYFPWSKFHEIFFEYLSLKPLGNMFWIWLFIYVLWVFFDKTLCRYIILYMTEIINLYKTDICKYSKEILGVKENTFLL